MSVRVRMAPSPTGFLHIGGVRTFLFNWLFARGRRGECLLRIENTDTSREVEEATEQIQRSLTWLGIEWDGPVTFQLDAMERCRELAARLVAEGRAYEDEGAIRFRMPDDGVTGWEDAVRGRIEFPNDQLEDLVIVRSDGRATYNFASPVEDMDDAITHVIRGDDHVSNTPKQIQILQALGHEPPVYAHVPSINGPDGRKLSKRHGAVSVDEFRVAGYLPDALMNFLALLGWAPDGETTIMSPGELVDALHVGACRCQPGHVRLRQARLDERRLPARAAARPLRGDACRAFSVSGGSTGLRSGCARRRRSCRRRSDGWASSRPSPVSSSMTSNPTRPISTPRSCSTPRRPCARSSRGRRRTIEAQLKALCDELGQKPRQVYAPIRVAVTGSRISPGLYESLELLGRDVTLERLRHASELAA